jgi:tetratricopeptide (TPR) repeat protein
MSECARWVLGAAALLPVLLAVIGRLAATYGAFRLSRAINRAAPYVFGPRTGEDIAFQSDVMELRETGKLGEAVDLAKRRLADPSAPSWVHNVAVDILISGGAYGAALRGEPSPRMPRNTDDAVGLTLIQINLAEAEYNLGRWDAAAARLRRLELACWRFGITRAGLLLQHAWISAHQGRADEAIALCAVIKPSWLPPPYRAEHHFAGAAALLAAGRMDEAEAAVDRGEKLAIRLSSKRNALFLRARIAAARDDWPAAERFGREAAHHPFRGQGGAGLLLWARSLTRLGRHDEAAEALALVAQRDPESEAAQESART